MLASSEEEEANDLLRGKTALRRKRWEDSMWVLQRRGREVDGGGELDASGSVRRWSATARPGSLKGAFVSSQGRKRTVVVRRRARVVGGFVGGRGQRRTCSFGYGRIRRRRSASTDPRRHPCPFHISLAFLGSLVIFR